MRELFSVAGALTLSAMLIGACEGVSLSVLDPPVEGGDGAGDAEVPDGDDGRSEASSEAAADDLSCGSKSANDAPCRSSDECCSGLCALDPRGQLTCRPTTGCLGNGQGCGFAGECCSLACGPVSDGPARARVSTPLCAPQGAKCTPAADCCSNR